MNKSIILIATLTLSQSLLANANPINTCGIYTGALGTLYLHATDAEGTYREISLPAQNSKSDLSKIVQVCENKLSEESCREVIVEVPVNYGDEIIQYYVYEERTRYALGSTTYGSANGCEKARAKKALLIGKKVAELTAVKTERGPDAYGIPIYDKI